VFYGVFLAQGNVVRRVCLTRWLRFLGREKADAHHVFFNLPDRLPLELQTTLFVRAGVFMRIYLLLLLFELHVACRLQVALSGLKSV